jgi:hypothetical protein
VKIPAAEIIELDALLESVAGALIATIGITARRSRSGFADSSARRSAGATATS